MLKQMGITSDRRLKQKVLKQNVIKKELESYKKKTIFD